MRLLLILVRLRLLLSRLRRVWLLRRRLPCLRRSSRHRLRSDLRQRVRLVVLSHRRSLLPNRSLPPNHGHLVLLSPGVMILVPVVRVRNSSSATDV